MLGRVAVSRVCVCVLTASVRRGRVCKAEPGETKGKSKIGNQEHEHRMSAELPPLASTPITLALLPLLYPTRGFRRRTGGEVRGARSSGRARRVHGVWTERARRRNPRVG